MKTRPPLRLLALVCIGCLASCAQQTQRVKVPVANSPQSNTSLTTQVFEAVNTYRGSQGARELQRHAGLDRLAQQHCEYLRQHRGTFSLRGKNVSHIGFEGRAMYAREYYHMENLGENVAAANRAGTNPAPVLVALWKSSKDHQRTMTDKWTHTGVGLVVDSDGTVFADQLFATVNGSLMSSRSRYTHF